MSKYTGWGGVGGGWLGGGILKKYLGGVLLKCRIQSCIWGNQSLIYLLTAPKKVENLEENILATQKEEDRIEVGSKLGTF